MNSKTLNEILKNNKGYRTEEFSGSNVRSLEEVLKYEIVDLGNTDLLNFMKSNYNILSDFKLDDNTLSEIKKETTTNEEFLESVIAEEQNLAISNSNYFIEEILTYVEKIFGTRNLIGLWLTNFENVIVKYKGTIENIKEYTIPVKHLILSDLDEDGILFVFKE